MSDDLKNMSRDKQDTWFNAINSMTPGYLAAAVPAHELCCLIKVAVECGMWGDNSDEIGNVVDSVLASSERHISAQLIEETCKTIEYEFTVAEANEHPVERFFPAWSRVLKTCRKIQQERLLDQQP